MDASINPGASHIFAAFMENELTDDLAFEFEWLQARHLVKRALKRESLPDMNAMLFLIGIQELGRWKESFTKEEKQDLMHIAVCRLMSFEGYFEFVGRDADGWPHYQAVKPFREKGVKTQEEYLKRMVVRYFREWEQENSAG